MLEKMNQDLADLIPDKKKTADKKVEILYGNLHDLQ